MTVYKDEIIESLLTKRDGYRARLTAANNRIEQLEAALKRIADVGPYETMHDIRLFAKAALTPPKGEGQ